MQILIVDDEPASRLLLAKTVERLGHDTVLAANGREALTVFNERIDVVLTDWLMPTVAGPELCAKLRANRRGTARYVYIILVTILSDKRSHVQGLTAGPDALQANAVREGRRGGLENQPYGKTGEKYQETIYDNFAYKHSVIGSMDDLNAASLQDVKDFFRIYYAPNNAALALVGDFKLDVALSKIKNYFEAIPSQPAPPPVDTTEPDQTAERRFTVEDPLARLPQVLMGYKGIVDNTGDAYAMQVLNQALASGQSSRLYQKLVKEKELVTGVFAFTNAMRGNGDYQITANVAPGKKIEDVEAGINEEISRMQTEPIADWELAKAKNSSRRSSIQALQGSLGTAIRLTQYTVFFNDPNLINSQFDKIAAVRKADVQRVANKYLKATNRTVGITIPQAKGVAAASSTN